MTLALLLGTLALCLVIGVPVFMALGIATVVALTVSDVPMLILGQTLYQGVDKFPLLAIPCFILAGSLMERGGVTHQIIAVVSQFTGRVRGGLGIATILACMFFSAISGSGPGTVAAVGSVMIPAMLRAGHGRDYAGAVSSSGGTLGILIPPSNPMIIYGVIAQTSIVGLFMAGIVPGMIIGVAHCLVAYLVARHVGYEATGERFDLRELARTCWRGKFAIAAPFLILGGIYAGVFTPVEASVIAVLYGLLVGSVVNRMLDLKAIFDSLIEAARISTAMDHRRDLDGLRSDPHLQPGPPEARRAPCDHLDRPVHDPPHHHRGVLHPRHVHGDALDDHHRHPGPAAGHRPARHRPDPLRDPVRGHERGRVPHPAPRGEPVRGEASSRTCRWNG